MSDQEDPSDEDVEQRRCRHCNKVFVGVGHNVTNFERHEGTCKKSRKRPGNTTTCVKSKFIKSFFLSAASSSYDDIDMTVITAIFLKVLN